MPMGALPEEQKNKLADDDGGFITTIVFHQRFFHSLFFTHCFSPTHLSTAVYPPLSLTVVSAVWWWCEAAATTHIIIYISIYIPN